MAKAPQAQAKKVYYVYDDNIPEGTRLGNSQIEMLDGVRIMRMTEAEAWHWIEQGAIGLKPMEQRREKAQAVASQLIGAEVASEEPSRRRK